MPQLTFGLDDATKAQLGEPSDGQWCLLTLRHDNKETRQGIAKYNGRQDVSAFADVRVEGLTYEDRRYWRIWDWKPTSPPDIDP